MSNSNIEWTDDTPNPVVGCTKKSAGCENCYAIRMAWRLMHSDKPAVREKYAGTVYKTPGGKLNWTGKINIDRFAMMKVMKQKKPKMYFVNSMGDLFHPNVPFPEIDRVFAVMAIAHWHTFQILTKHPDRMLEWLNYKDPDWEHEGMRQDNRIRFQTFHCYGEEVTKSAWQWPLPNVWMGTSVENQKEAYNRKYFLKLISDQGWLTWVSNEPALGNINWRGYEFIKWMVTGGESGPGSRPMHPGWARQARDFCEQNNVPFFFKQWGVYSPGSDPDFYMNITGKLIPAEDASYWIRHEAAVMKSDKSQWTGICKLGKHAAGRLLDGKIHNDFPETSKIIV